MKNHVEDIKGFHIITA